MTSRIVIFGVSNILSDLVDCALANGIAIAAIVRHLPEPNGARNLPLSARLQSWSHHGIEPLIIDLDDFQPADGELYLLGPTTPQRAALAQLLQDRFALTFTTLIHPTAYLSPLARLGAGGFIGAGSVIGPGAQLADHVFVNRSASIGHDSQIGSFSRIQPGSAIGGLCRIGTGVTIGIGARVIERIQIGDGAFIGAGAVVTKDVAAATMMFGNPARMIKRLHDAE